MLSFNHNGYITYLQDLDILHWTKELKKKWEKVLESNDEDGDGKL